MIMTPTTQCASSVNSQNKMEVLSDADQCWLDPSEVSMVDPSVADLPGLTGQTLRSIEVNDT